jgi:hypothetical protein
MIPNALADLSAYVLITALVVLVVFIARHYPARLRHGWRDLALGDLLGRGRSL